MWLASASLHCEMQLNSPGAINGLLIQTRPGGGAAPSPTGRSGVLVALPFLLWLFSFLISGWCWDNQKREEHGQPRRRHRVETHKHGIVSSRHAKARAGLFSFLSYLYILLLSSAQSQCRIPRTLAHPTHPRTTWPALW